MARTRRMRRVRSRIRATSARPAFTKIDSGTDAGPWRSEASAVTGLSRSSSMGPPSTTSEAGSELGGIEQVADRMGARDLVHPTPHLAIQSSDLRPGPSAFVLVAAVPNGLLYV